jgi:sortase A
MRSWALAGTVLLSATLASSAAAALPDDNSPRHGDAFHCPPDPGETPRFPEAIAWVGYPRFGLLVPVVEGTETEQLARGAGLVDGTALPGVPDRRRNCVIAAHRTTYFSPLESAVVGDLLTVITGAGAEEFVVDRILIVSPDDVELEAPTSSRRLTLVTCTPFNYLGDAPKRFVVLASPRAGRHPHARGGRPRKRTVKEKTAPK